MTNSNLDVWAIQYGPQELETALSNLKVLGNTILYTNALCSFKIGNMNISSRQFDTFLYSEENDLLVMLMRGGRVTADDIRKYLENHNIYYNEVVLTPSVTKYEDNYKMPELWIAREKCVVDDALHDSIKKGVKRECGYYPNLYGSLNLSYLTNSNDITNIDGRLFKGLIYLEDKLILLVNQNDKRNVRPLDVFESLKRTNFKYALLDNQPTVIEGEIKSKSMLK
jgi:hypothetical protein